VTVKKPLIRVLIVDDEELARLRMRTLVGDCTELGAQVVGEAAHAEQAMQWLAANDCDVALLDIHMPGSDGMQLAARMRDLPVPPAVVFVTAHAEHALHAFELEAVDYLTKPVRLERLKAALQRVAQRMSARPSEMATEPDAQPVIVVSDLGRKVRVPLSEVLYLKAELKYVTLRTSQHTHVLDDTLTELENRLGDRFLRIHRNALVARRALRTLERRVLSGEADDEGAEAWVVQIAATGEWLQVSRRQVSAVKDAIAEGGL
jgi:two-component system, LytTR family, response regulator AlgR